MVLISLSLAATANAQLTFTKAFVPDTIGPGSVSTLTFTITNTGASNESDLAFTDNLPAGVTIATPAAATNACGGTLSAPDGGTTIDFSGGEIAPAPVVCVITVNVTATAAVDTVFLNTSGDLTSTAGNSGPASAILNVDIDRPGFTKSFSPNPVPFGYRSTLTLTIDNTANPALANNPAFVDPLPAGVEIADPANASTTCGGTIIAIPGTSIFSYAGGSVAASSSCSVIVDVLAAGVGLLGNTTGELTSGFPTVVSSGKAAAVLEVTVDPLSLIKSFTDDPLPPGATGTLEFTITNYDRFDAATNVTFTDDLNATLAGLAATGLPLSNVCGTGSTLSGTGVVTLSGGNLAPGASCTFSATIQVPGAAAAGAYVNTTSSISGDIGGNPVTGSPGEETLFISPAPILTKTFTDDPVGGGGTVTLEFVITNTSPSSSATNISFDDSFDIILPTASAVPVTACCGVGSVCAFTPAVIATSTPAQLSVSNASLGPGASCGPAGISLTLDVSAGAPAGTYVNTTSEITATVGGTTVTGSPASDSLVVVAPPLLVKEFTDDPVLPGGTVTMQLTLTHDPLAAADATSINFTDDLNSVVAGLQATGLPLNDICGTGSQISGTTNLSFTGGTLAPGATCTFPVTLQVPAAAPAGNHSNTTSNVTATLAGVTAVGNGASDDLIITGLTFSKSFTDDPVIPGGTVTLEFTLDNTLAPDGATAMTFSDNLTSALSGLVATGLPQSDICGTGSSITGTSFLTFTGGNLPAGGSCTFSVTLDVPAAAADGVYGNTTSPLTATVGTPPAAAVLSPAVDGLTVSSELLSLTKTFTDDPVAPGGNVTLELILLNLDGSQTATGIGFTDDLDAALTGLTAVGLPAAGFCGPGSTIAGTGLLTVAGAELGPGASCTFSVTLQVPAAAPSVVTNTTSSVNGLIGGLPVTGPPASDDLMINNLSFSKSFSGAVFPGQTVGLTFEIQNISTSTVTDISFLDDLDAVLAGLAATGLPSIGDCGAASTVSGTGAVQLANGSLAPGGSCTINVTVQVPAGATPGTYLNTTSDLFVGGTPTVVPATANLTIEPPPAFSKGFAPITIVLGDTSTLTLTIDNSASTVTATGLDLTDSLPAGMEIANPTNASTTCTGGTLTAVAGSGTIAYSGGTVAAGVSCTVVADVTGTTVGTLDNTTGNLTSSAGDSGTAFASLQVTAVPLPVLVMSFDPTVVEPGVPSRMMLTIDNSAAFVDATGLQLSLNLPANVIIADPANASATCTGGTLTAVAGTSLFDYSGGTVAAGAICTLQADVVAVTVGTYEITSGDLTSSIGNSGPASATLQVSGQQMIPTLDLWGLLILGCLIGLVALWRIRVMAS
jgi:uncharacterized repeat protein (TIGR01451 family)